MAHWRRFLDAEARGGRYLPWKEVARVTGLSRTTAWRLQKRDDFPAPYLISPGRVGFREEEVDAWRASRAHSPARVGPPRRADPSPPPEVAPRPQTLSSGARLSEPEVLSGPPAPPTDPATAVKRKSVQRRRSQHARAIANQMLFDF